jgi:hypothetical protein
LDFRFIHLYSHASLDANAVAGEIAKVFPGCKVDVRPPFRHDERIEQARITNVKQPFERQPKQPDGTMPLYDGFVLQRLFSQSIPVEEAEHVHIIFTGLFTCTFSEDDWRYHGRAVVCGTPSIISTTGIVEAPAKPREFYLAQRGMVDVGSLKKKFAGRFIDYGDDRMAATATAYALQALFFFVADGEPFCDDESCMLYNAHWQEELIRMIEKGALCGRHWQMVNKFNKRSARH